MKIKLIDFWHCKAIEDAEQVFHPDLPKASYNGVDAIGSPYYMAPEMITDSIYNPKCDTWSIGCVLYLMLTNVPPFNGLEDSEVIAKIMGRKF